MSQETIRKLAHDPVPITPELRRMMKLARQWAKETDREIDEHAMGLFALHLLAPFGALLEAAERAEREIIWLSLQAFPSRTQEMAIQNSPAIQALRAALADVKRGE